MSDTTTPPKADYRATLLRPTTLEPAGLHVRNGVLGDVHVPYDRIARLEEMAGYRR